MLIVPERYLDRLHSIRIQHSTISNFAYATHGPNPLKDFVFQHFGEGRGALLGRSADLPIGMKYIRKYVLSDGQIDGLVGAVEHRLWSDN